MGPGHPGRQHPTGQAALNHLPDNPPDGSLRPHFRSAQTAQHRPVSRQHIAQEPECSRATAKRIFESMGTYLSASIKYGDQVEVLVPGSLRQQVQQQLLSALTLYRKK